VQAIDTRQLEQTCPPSSKQLVLMENIERAYDEGHKPEAILIKTEEVQPSLQML